ncbi:MAG: GH92 family glycosyl hydrolase [Proteobacteria bacterium]|nr:GH92 family glycosyl hydrolase [Pseudomonadota bacterium]
MTTTKVLFALALMALGCGGSRPAVDGGGDRPDTAPPMTDLVQHVDPFIGTDDSDSPHPVPGGAGGSAYPGAVVPFGMVQLSPDTPTASPSGYRYSDSQIEQFSVTHFDGAGCPNNEDLPFLPIVGPVTGSPATNWASYRTAYDKASEQASPGYYRVTLAGDIGVELTTTTRTGFSRIQYPASTDARLLLHTGRSATGVRAGLVKISPDDRMIRGTATAGGFCGSNQTFAIHFAIEVDAPISNHGTWLGDSVAPGVAATEGVGSGAWVGFDTTNGAPVHMKIGISFVSMANAEANLTAENPGWDFDAVRNKASSRWNKVLNRIQVTGGSDADRTKFYTALYRVFQSPNVANDTNGEYMGFDRAVHTADGWTVYQNYSGWDIIRSWTHLVAAVAPETPDIVRSMVQDGVHGGLLPFWSHQNVEVRVMVGDPGTVNVANAYAMGVRGFDTNAALALMIKSATDPQDTHRYGLADWLSLHYLNNAAIALEYAMADFALAQFAGALGETAVRDEYLARSAYWRENWNEEDGFIEPRVGTPIPGTDAARIYELAVFGPDAPDTNLATAGTATASASCNANEGPDKAINGTWTGGYSDKWCDNTSAEKWLQIDLGAARSIDRFTVYHAGAGGESPEWNTQDFAISVSADGETWTEAVSVTGNGDDMTTHALGAVTARYVRLTIEAAVQGGNVGDWSCQPFDPAAECGFIEGNGSQYVWMVPHDLAGLIALMGGAAAAIPRLDEHFTELNAGTKRPFFYIGNEPEHGTPWTYNFAGAPWKTQALVARIVDEEFTTSAGGLPGNNDLGSTSAWLVWSYLGMYPVIPGMDVLVVNGPRFEAVDVHLANGNTLAIRADGAGAGAPYVQSLAIGGADTTRSWLRFGDVSGGGELTFTMGDAPNKAWGSGEADLPPSFTP